MLEPSDIERAELPECSAAYMADLEDEWAKAQAILVAIVTDYPVSAGLAKGIASDEQGYGSIRAAAEYLGLTQRKEDA